jgi:hypothetical protein
MADNKYAKGAERDHASVDAEKLQVSFDYLDLGSEHFFIHGLSPDHYRKIFDCINAIAKSTEAEISKQTHPSLVPKSIFNKKGTYPGFPAQLLPQIAERLLAEQKRGAAASAQDRDDANTQAKTVIHRAFEVRVGKTYGRIHGIIWDKVFYVVWFDPAHNLYPDDRHGIKLHDAFATVKGFGPDEVTALKVAHDEHCAEFGTRYEQLKSEHEELLKVWAQSEPTA